MQRKFRLPDDVWEQFLQKTSAPAETLRQLVTNYIHNDSDPLDEVMGVEEAAEKWDMPPGTIKNLCAAGEVKAKKIGNRWIISKKQQSPRPKSN
ncbi:MULTISPECIES: helix-turn-helix domain-containing protein [Bacillus]|uniref:helix-turn-helix domain-containing protein n=1 Tax=Bacillus TaxID=1386 RepID=UPI00157260F8|nr:MULTISPECIES: helix-turn-helix domain-containing protein [Bacillus]MBC6975099.1 helix-turn-helix domain-containing protein [Bacillus sp. Xin]MBY0600391.1 helix-turn-helix domain-containing protein [Bacillus bingmayongensis]NSW38428.1 helix-turn-helix domain-containing protein [Bacillus sp. Xin1]